MELYIHNSETAEKSCMILHDGDMGVSPSLNSPPILGDIGDRLRVFQQFLKDSYSKLS